jgi:hypothetical protein
VRALECPRIVSTDVDVLRPLANVGECEVMAQPVARSLLVSPLINQDFRGRYLMLASGNLGSATLNHQMWPSKPRHDLRGLCHSW